MTRYLSILMLLFLLATPMAGRAAVPRGTMGPGPVATQPFGDFLAVTGMSSGIYAPTAEGISNGDSTYYFPGKNTTDLSGNSRAILTVKRGDEAQAAPPEVTALQLPPGPQGGMMARVGSELYLATESELIRATADDIPTTATIQVVPAIGTVKGFDVRPETGRLLRLGSRLECYDPSPSGFVLRGTAAITGQAMVVDGESDTIVVVDNGALRTLRWQEGAAAPEVGQVLQLPAYRPELTYVSLGSGGMMYLSLDNSIRSLRIGSFPQAPIMADIAYPNVANSMPIPIGPAGMLTRYRTYIPFNPDGTVPDPEGPSGQGLYMDFPVSDLTEYIPRVAFGTPRGPMVGAISLPLAMEYPVNPFCQVSINPTHAEKFIHGVSLSIPSNQRFYLTSIGYDAGKAGGAVHLALYSAGTVGAGPTPYNLVWEGDSTTTVAGRNWVPLPTRPLVMEDTVMALAVRCEDPDLLAFGYEGWWTVWNYTSFTLPASQEEFPASFQYSSKMARHGSVGLVANYESVAWLNKVSIQNATPIFDYMQYGITSNGRIWLLPEGSFDVLEVSETPDFSGEVDRYPDADSRAPVHQLRNLTPGEHTLYFRGTAGPQVTGVVSTRVTVDPFPPSVPGKPVCSGGSPIIEAQPEFSWTPSEDEGGAGIRNYEFEVAGDMHYTDTTDYGQTSCRPFTNPPRLIRVRARAIDGVGNASAWSEFSDDVQTLLYGAPDLTMVETTYEFQSQPRTWFRYTRASANPEIIEMSEDPDFATVQSETWYEGGRTHQSLFDLEDREGLHTTYHRLRGAQGTSQTLEKKVFLDSVDPVAQAPVPVSNFGANGSMDLVWRLPVDPEPASGIESARLRVGGGGYLFARDLTHDSPTTVTVTLPVGVKGGTFWAMLTGLDRAGNRSAEISSASTSFTINAKPMPPTTASVSPAAPTSADWIEVSAAGAVDPDGDEIAGYTYSFSRQSPEPRISVQGPMLTPDQTTRGETWCAYASAIDSRGAYGFSAQTPSFTIANSKPTRPFVRILPPVAEPGKSIVVDVIQYSIDPDGDEVGYDFRWSKSLDNGATWIAKLELDGSPQVDGQYIREGELWKIEYVPYEKTSAKIAKAERVEGQPGWDIVHVGADNLPPVLTARQPRANPPAPDGTTHIRATWNATDPEGGPVVVDLFLTNLGTMDLTPVAQRIAGSTYEFNYALPPGGGPYYLHMIAYDSAGAITQTTTLPLLTVEPGGRNGWMLE